MTADIIDDANDHAARELELRITAARGHITEPSENCINCGDPAQPDSRFCGRECRDDHEQQLKMLKRQGKA